jgi:hypothetical protein
MAGKKEKKPKVRYVDDGRTLADMSALRGVDKRYTGPKGGFRAQARTYWNAVKLMFVPMMVTIGIISLAFLVMWLMLTIGYTANP